MSPRSHEVAPPRCKSISACTSASRNRSTTGTPGNPTPMALRTTLCAPSAPTTHAASTTAPSSRRTVTLSGRGWSPWIASAPFDVSAERRQPVAECALDIGLRHQQPAGTAEAGRLPDREARQFTSVDVDGDAADRQAAVGQVAECAEAVENLDAARLQAQRPRGHRRARGLVEHPHVDACRPQPARQREARRPGTRHYDVASHVRLPIDVSH